ncbi:MAG: leucine-rich repeat domain-containing protein [Treponema sp.]|nr:leucine-rich repeat domain-containing protein [Treponema sp.]
MNKKWMIFCLTMITLCFVSCPEYGPFNVYYYGDSGTTGDPPRDGAGYLYGEKAIILAKPDGFRKGDREFRGWREEYSSFIYKAGDAITIDRDIHLYAQWEGDEENGFTYRIASGEVVITGYNADYWDYWERDLIIPSSIDGLPVAHIGDNAFYNQYIYGLSLPGALKTIGSKAFAGGAGLNGVLTIPDSVTSIGDLAFQGCHISALELGDGLQAIGVYAFEGNSITALRIPPNTRVIGNGAFDDNDIRFIKIGEGVTIESDNALGKHGGSFRALYDAGKSAGVYVYEKGQWEL